MRTRPLRLDLNYFFDVLFIPFCDHVISLCVGFGISIVVTVSARWLKGPRAGFFYASESIEAIKCGFNLRAGLKIGELLSPLTGLKVRVDS